MTHILWPIFYSPNFYDYIYNKLDVYGLEFYDHANLQFKTVIFMTLQFPTLPCGSPYISRT